MSSSREDVVRWAADALYGDETTRALAVGNLVAALVLAQGADVGDALRALSAAREQAIERGASAYVSTPKFGVVR